MTLLTVSKNILPEVKVGPLAETEGLVPKGGLESQELLKRSDRNVDLPRSRKAVG